MKISFHRPAQNERYPELQYAIVLTGFFVVAVLVGFFLPDRATPICIFHRLTGIPCFTCGMSRSWRLLLNGEWSTAFRMQPLFVLLLASAAVWTTYAWIVIVLRLPRLRLGTLSQRTKRAIAWGLVALVLINWAYLILIKI
jgi:hypothetical protein